MAPDERRRQYPCAVWLRRSPDARARERMYMKIFGREVNLTVREALIVLISLAWLYFQLYIAFFRPLKPIIQNPLHLVCALAIAILHAPLAKGVISRGLAKALWCLDAAMLAGLGFEAWYLFSQASRLEKRIQYVSPLQTIDFIAMACVVLILLECVRRTMGKTLLFFILAFLAYFAFGPYLPGILRHSGTSLAGFTDLMIMGTDGIFGAPLNASSNYLYYFIFFGAFLADYGGGRVLIELGMKIGSGAGAPAKAAVMSSCFMGMVNGSAVANVTTTGVFTIPLMKKVGYSKEEAGAIEAVASTGGQIMPPIMGIGAFLMAEIVGIPYGTIALRAVIPALAYFGSALLLVDFLARKKKLAAMEGDELEISREPVLPRVYLLFPIVVLIYYIVAGKSLMFSVVRATITILLLNLFQKIFQKRGMGIRDIFQGIISSTKQVSEIAIPTGACGLIIASVVMSGLATKMANIIAGAKTESMLVGLLVAMLGCLILGMALPTVAAYLSAYVLFVPSLIKLGLSAYIANMFIFYFGIFAQITPPVALASIAAAGIAGGNAWKTGWTGFSYALVAMLVPFVFAYNPGILLIGTPMEIIASTFYLCAGTFFLVVAVSGYLFMPIRNTAFRFVIFLIAIAIIVPETISTFIGLICAAVVVVAMRLVSRRIAAAEANAPA